MTLLANPMTAKMIFELGEFQSEQTMYRRLKQLCDAGLIQIVGYMPNESGTGCPVHVYAAEKWKGDNMHHEVVLSKILLRWKVPAIRGYHVDPELRPDATLVESNVHVELDTGSMHWPRVVKRLRKYEGCQDCVLFLTSTETRVSGVLSRCESLSSTLLACTHEEALNGAVLTDCVGEKTTLKELLKNLLENQHGELP